jgi:signal transduction histidine kinase
MHRRHQVVRDAAVPVLVGGIILVVELVRGGSSAEPAPIALGLAAAATLLGRRRWPGWTLAASGGLVVLLFQADPDAGIVGVLAPAIALYSLALKRGRGAQLVAGLAAVGAVLALELHHSDQVGVLPTLGHLLLIAIPLLVAAQVRSHHSNLKLLRERLELAERAREQEAERRTEQERMRIARELHDVVAHTLTEINLQAASISELLAPGDARAGLERIEDSSREAIGELRAILGLLRDPERPESPRAPAPGIDDIAKLVERARATGLDARLEISGTKPESLSDAVSLAAYRIVQESLTNARRHAPGALVRIDLGFGAGAVSVAIENGPGDPSNGNLGAPGVGIVGMRERATSLGGTLDAGPTPEGFRVHAELPCEAGP